MPRKIDGLSDRAREFVRLRRERPETPAYEIAELAGYIGNQQKLKERARVLLKDPKIYAAVIAPTEKPPEKPITDEDLKDLIRRRLHKVLVNEKATDSDAIKAADKLLATIVGGYVPVQVKQTGSFTLESWVAKMGGAPAELTTGEDHA